MSIEIDYLRRKANYFQRRQTIGLTIIICGFIITIAASRLTLDLTALLIGYILTLAGIVLVTYYNRRFSTFIAEWAIVMEELERKIKDYR